jgi:UDP-N-acetylmuramoyl-L-alanyl-D-glutamate--2,6-diaminopimelate ligase
VLNRDDDSYEFLADLTSVRQLCYGAHPRADFRVDHVKSQMEGISFDLISPSGKHHLVVPLLGVYNAWNCLAAFSAAVGALGIAPEQAASSLEQAVAVPGRMEPIQLGQKFEAIVDFAHTPNALKQALRAARQRTGGRVIAIFGSAGLRDRAKRRLMAEVSARSADVTILTAEDPRTESLDSILQEMAGAAEAEGATRGSNLFLEPDRGQAIRRGLKMAEEGDLVIACGKGHEQSMCFGTTEFPWDDRLAMRAALSEYLDIDGPAMPQLPTSVAGAES